MGKRARKKNKIVMYPNVINLVGGDNEESFMSDICENPRRLAFKKKNRLHEMATQRDKTLCMKEQKTLALLIMSHCKFHDHPKRTESCCFCETCPD